MNLSEPHHGHTAGVPLGSMFRNRQSLRDARIHRPLQAGIDGNKNGAYSIVVSGGYVDDKDLGDQIIYTGQGGNDPNTKRQIADQQWTRGNAALRFNSERSLPVRVARGYKGDSAHSPAEGYRYDGVFLVESSWEEVGVDGFQICRFKLIEARHLVEPADQHAQPWAIDESPVRSPQPPASAEPDQSPAGPAHASGSAFDHLNRPAAAQDWIVDLVASETFQAQRQAKAPRLSAGRVQAVLAWLNANGGQLSHAELAAVTEVPVSRLSGLVATLTRCLNLDGYPVLADDGVRVMFDDTLAKTQFGIS